jgi:hypothetical protein
MINFRLMVLVGAAVMLTGCASIAPPQPPSLELPKPPADLRAVRKGDRVVLTWTAPTSTTDRRTIRKLGLTEICRGTEVKLAACGTPVGSVAAPAVRSASATKVASSDSLGEMLSENPAGFMTYAVEVLNPDGRDAGLSNQVRVSTVRTLAPPEDFKASVTGQGVGLSWRGEFAASHSEAVRHVVRVFRRPEGGAEWTVVGSVAVGSGGSLTDPNIEWEKTYAYRAETVTMIAPELEVEGDDTPEVRVFAHDVFPPAVPAGLQAVYSGPGQAAFVDLIWAPVSDLDLEGYDVYRHEEGAAPVKVNASVVKVPAYRDGNVVAGKTYFYSVSAVDVRGNESGRSEEASERVP